MRYLLVVMVLVALRGEVLAWGDADSSFCEVGK
jgi:hypothetical protein